MMTKSYFEEFDKKFNRPKMNSITVGFSGIDPAPKTEEKESGINADEFLTSYVATNSEIREMLDKVWC